MAEADDVDEGPLGRVEPERAPGPDLEFVSSQLERARVELVEARRCLQAGPSAPPGDGDVDGGGDGIGQAMARKRGLQAQRRERDPLGDLDKVGVGGRSIGPAVDAATEREDLPGVPQGVKPPIGDAGLLGLAVGERVTQLLSKIRGPGHSHGRKSYPHPRYMSRISFTPPNWSRLPQANSSRVDCRRTGSARAGARTLPFDQGELA